MKKFIVLFLVFSFLIGCNSQDNTPSKRVSIFLSNYQNLDDSLLNELDYSIESNTLNEEQKNIYREIMKHQYKDLTYEIIDEKIDGDISYVTVIVEVYNLNIASVSASEFFKMNQDFFLNDDGSVDVSSYIDYKLDLMKNINDRVKHEILFIVRKKDNIWIMDDINEIDREKIHGLYAY